MDPLTGEDSGGLTGDSLDVGDLCRARRWSRMQLISALRRVAADDGQQLPSDESLKRMIRLWVKGTRVPSKFYADLLARAFGVARLDIASESTDELLELLDRGDSVADSGLVTALESQTQSLRVLDRRLGGHRLLNQAMGHVRTVQDLLQWSPYGKVRRDLAATGAEAAALAGWQALDLGRPKLSWKLHARARTMAQESGNAGVLAHVTAQQAYALLDARRPDRAVLQFEEARKEAGSRVPDSIRAWLAAAEAEGRATAGDAPGASRLLTQAERHTQGYTEDVPFIVLNEAHFARWRGSCLARVGHPEAIRTLTRALDVLDPDFTRAAAGLHADLATAHSVNGDVDAARQHAQIARTLSAATGSARQHARVEALLRPEGKQM